MTREEIIKGLEAAHQESGRYGCDEFGDRAIVDRALIWETLEIIKHSEPIINGVWKYYVNEMGKARWRCSVCGHVVKHDPNDFKRCACGAHMRKEC